MKSEPIIPNYKYFESQENDEQVIFVIRRHWTILCVPFLMAGIILILITVMGFLISRQENLMNELGKVILVCVIGVAVLFTVAYAFLSWLIRYLSIIVLTNEHLVEIEQNAVFSRKVSELDLECIEDAASFEKGFFQTMLKFGTVLVQTAGELPNFEFKGIADPNTVQQKIMEAKEVYMKQNHYNTISPQNNPVTAQPEQTGNSVGQPGTPTQ